MGASAQAAATDRERGLDRADQGLGELVSSLERGLELGQAVLPARLESSWRGVLGHLSGSGQGLAQNGTGAVQGRGQPFVTGEDGIRSLAVGLAVQESAKTGHRTPVRYHS